MNPLFATICFAFLPQEDAGGHSLPLDWWTDNLRWAIDESVRGIVNGDGDVATLAFFGLDVHKVFSTGNRDIATLTLQPYLTRVDDLVPTPPIFDAKDDWELVWRIFNANLKLRQDGALHLRLGHFELPFGLEHTINTNGTLRDYTHGPNFGIKADWGATVNGDLRSFEYEAGWSRGSGNQYRDDGGSGVMSARIGTPRDDDVVLGASFATGDFRTPAGVVDRWRSGVDAQFYREDFGYFAELAVGQDNSSVDVVRGLGEVNWRNAHETVLCWWQLIASEMDGAMGEVTAVDTRLGIRWTPAKGWTVSAQYSQVLDGANNTPSRRGALTLQLRYRF